MRLNKIILSFVSALVILFYASGNKDQKLFNIAEL